MDWMTPAEVEALMLSLKVSVTAVIAILPFGIAAAWLLARRDFFGKTLVDGLIHLPLVVPPVVIGYLLLVLLGRRGVVGAWLYDVFDISIAFTWRGAAVAAAVMAFPLMVRAIRLSFEAVDPRLETAARTLGAGPMRVFFTLTLPLVTPGILTGCVLAFARALGEFGATITFVSNIPGETSTLPLAIFSSIQNPSGEEAAFRLTLLAIALSLAALAASEFLSRRLSKRLKG